MTTPTKPLRIAITGAGVAGASLMFSLQQYKATVDVHIFEAAPTFREAGLAIGIGRHGQQALDLLAPTGPSILTSSKGVPTNGTWFYTRDGEFLDKCDYERFTKKGEDQRLETIVQRSDFVKALLEGVEKERMHAGKQVMEILQNGQDEEVKVKFKDGTEHVCDVLIGADGIKSFVRGHVLGHEDPAVKPSAAGWYILWMMRPYEQARRLLGSDVVNLEDHKEYVYLDDGTVILHNVSGGGELVQFAACVWDKELRDKGSSNVDWMKRVDKQAELEKFKNWPEKFRKTLAEFLDEEEDPKGFVLSDHSVHARTYVKGTVAVMGDAAHAPVPWQASGGCMSLEDSLVLSSLLSRCHSRSEAAIALEVYEDVRRPRTQAIVDSSRRVGMIATGQDEEYGNISVERMRGNLAHWWDYIIWFDNEKSRNEAVKVFEERLQKSKH